MRIAIIGAGATGLTAAWELKKRGFHDVVVFEKEERVGGKTCSIMHKGEAFDLGSMTFSTMDQTAIFADQFGIPYEQVEAKRIYLDGKQAFHPFAYARRFFSFFELIASYARFRSLVRKFRVLETGYHQVVPELCVPFETFSKTHRIEALARAAEPAFTGYGYGFYSEVPAAYAMKLLASMLDGAFLSTLFFRPSMMCYFPGGWTQVWERMAQQLIVRLGTPVLGLVYQEGMWQLTTKQGVEVFDRVIMTSSLQQCASLFPADTALAALTSQIRSYRMVSTLIEGSCALPSGFLVQNTNKSRFGHVQGIECYKPHTRCSVLFQIVPEDMSMAHIDEKIAKDLAVFDCRVRQVISRREWEYFYHVSPQALQDGFYDQLYARQGERGLYFANSILNFESVQRCQELAHEIVEMVTRER